MAATQSGAFVNFGFTGTDGITGIGSGNLLQSADYEPGHEEAQIKSATGDLATRVFYNLHKKATLEVIPSSTTAALAVGAQTTLLGLMRTIIAITACASMPELIESKWLVVGVKTAKSNADASKVTLTLEQHAGITSTPA